MSLSDWTICKGRNVTKDDGCQAMTLYFYGHIHNSQVYNQVNTAWWYQIHKKRISLADTMLNYKCNADPVHHNEEEILWFMFGT